MKKFLPLILILSLALVAACTQYGGTTTTTQAPTTTTGEVMEKKPSVTVDDQKIEDDTVTVAKVISDGPGWMTIHADANGAPGAGIGHAAVSDGENADVVVEIDASAATETLYAMLHIDVGEVGVYEFPGDDVPATVDGKPVTPSFKISGTGVSTTTTTLAAKIIEIASTGFSPTTLTIKTGEKVTFVNKDSSRQHWPASAVHPTHVVYPESGGCIGSKFDACKGLALNEEWSFSFNEKGTWQYHDHLNPSLFGTIVVE